MGRTARNVYVEAEDIWRIQGLVVALPSQVRVRVTMRDDDIHAGTVAERPTAQVFEDASCASGMNALLRLDDGACARGGTYLWLSEIQRVERLVENQC
ncbi:MAG: DUF3247 family protein [Rudaea sp.]